MAFDFERLKAVAKRLGGILVMEGNDPQFVILSYDQYVKLEETPSVSQNDSATKGVNEEEERLIEQLNNEILALKEEIRHKESSTPELV